MPPQEVLQGTSYNLECVTVIEIIAVDYTERFFDDILTHKDSMVSAPWLLTSFRASESLRQSIDGLETKFALHLSFVFGKYLCAELLLKVLADYPYNLFLNPASMAS